MPTATQRPDGKYLFFWRARCRVTGREMKFHSALTFFPTSFEVMADWVGRYFRELELLEYRPWGESGDEKRVLFPVPVQHVKFTVRIPDLRAPEPRSRSLLVRNPAAGGGASLSAGRSLLTSSLLKGASHARHG